MIGVHFPHLNVFSSQEKRLSTVRVDTLSLMVDVKDVKDDWLFNNTQSAPDVPWHSAPYEPLYLALFKQSSIQTLDFWRLAQVICQFNASTP